MNYIDIFIILILIAFGVLGYFGGFIKIFSEFFFLSFSLLFSFLLNSRFSQLLQSIISLPPNLLKVMSFLILLMLFKIIFSVFEYLINLKVPDKIKRFNINKYFGIFPGLIKGIFWIAMILTILIALPTSGNIKEKIFQSSIGKPLVAVVSDVERRLEPSLGSAINETFTLLTIKPDTEESVDLKFKTNEVSIDTQSEEQMLEFVNNERARHGFKPLIMDEQLRKVAREHSKDMFARGYFAHNNVEGKTPFDRISSVGIKYIIAGENLALAANVEIAHKGLMNSPGHKANILNPEFGKVGIGVLDGGVYGKMFTQNFTD
ncbi:hypothetical protein COX95_03320 [bacterium CG_4_10_14_0_2_um_filter_33_32]|nr:MAG: hypothetical protein COU50_02910 [bacterium CG10_big_fil_rev_8_21_14_0_10_33_18]PIU77042.1 MAG: hypothetical protein COS74_00775 [bacterium CG06_land_8_20_14_3_00_33_50]PIW81389.1 MAG: hypothetical protein COZ97_01995 [bacterium CG_4_8_14_3_um_filter_33_28]PIZ85595.1 MAG: hypothetical protein COX95_03320 [bacterium CG_4_10_14_0_2_um_filter_33_32]PJA71903.1 MAG: hypothetical protein CO152_04100 [bacterium CG_4_9_14_3_um_filter_33_26]